VNAHPHGMPDLVAPTTRLHAAWLEAHEEWDPAFTRTVSGCRCMVVATCTKACVWLRQPAQRGVHVATSIQFRLDRYGRLWAKYTEGVSPCSATRSVHLAFLPPGTLSFLYKRDLSHRGGPQATPFLVLVLCLAVLLLLAVITALAFAASRPVLQPVRRLARAAQRMSGGDLSVRIQPRGRDELAQLVTSFNEMAAALEGKVSDLERLEARARRFAGDVSPELRTPLTAMTAVVGILHEHPGLTGDAAAWASPLPGRTRACTAVTSTRATTRTAARYSP
jgi:HAMP domain-containing protein